VDVSGIKADIIVVRNTVKDALDKHAEALKNPAPLLRLLAIEIERQKDREFETGGLGTWKPSKNPKGKTLRDTGRLKRSYITRTTADSVILGSNYNIAAIHHYGGTIRHPGSEARKGKALAFQTASGTVVVRRTKPHDITIPSRPLHGIPPGPPKRQQEMDMLMRIATRYIQGAG
jgi:phage gpG-like protein